MRLWAVRWSFEGVEEAKEEGLEEVCICVLGVVGIFLLYSWEMMTEGRGKRGREVEDVDEVVGGKVCAVVDVDASDVTGSSDSVEGEELPKRMGVVERETRISEAVGTILECLDDDSTREGLRKTPMRFARALLSFTEGYRMKPEDVVGDAEFDENHNEIVFLSNVDLYSLCEHHMVPFFGKVSPPAAPSHPSRQKTTNDAPHLCGRDRNPIADPSLFDLVARLFTPIKCHIAYIPRGKVIGLSKLARIAEMFSQRLQIQERLTRQIAQAVQDAVQPDGVAVMIEAT